MQSLPTGTVTLLFSDIEGSTALLMRLGAEYADALDGMRSVLRSAWVGHDGREMGTEGDSFFVVFPSAVEAISAAVEGQRGLAAYPWPEDEEVRVRIGVHTGSPMVHDGGYVGKDVHLAARVAGAAHGGQVVLSEPTAQLVREQLPEGAKLRNLGSHQLKDIPRPERLYQLVLDDLPSNFPPLKTVGAGSNLPMPPDELVGRDKELTELTETLAWGRARLLTLTGPGGAGKTRLAIEVAHELVGDFTDGVYFVPLASVTSADVLWTTVAEILDLRLRDNVADQLLNHLRHRKVLLVLDNLEQLEGADTVVAEMLAHASALAMIATSRRPLHLSAEHEHSVATLDVPDTGTLAAAQRSEAVQLFVQQAQRIRSTFMLTEDNAADIAALCRRLDGLPLALELAAARTKLLSPHALLARLDQALDMPAAGVQAPDRQKTLRQAIAWSDELLSPPMRSFFHQLGVFSGGADLEAIADVAVPAEQDARDTLDLVTDLVDASLLTVDETADGEPRIDMLHTVRTYARELLQAGGTVHTVRERHAAHYLGLAERIAPALVGRARVSARTTFEREHDNFRAALEWCLTGDDAEPDDDRVQTGLRLVIALNDFWVANGYLGETRRWLERAVRRADGRESAELARTLSLLARRMRVVGSTGHAHDLAIRGLDMARRLDPAGPATMVALNTMAALEWGNGRRKEARALYQETATLARALGDQAYLQLTLVDYAALESDTGDHQRSLDLTEEALGLALDLGHTVGALISQHNAGWTLLEMGRLEEAAEQMRRVIVQALDLDEPSILLPLALDFSIVLGRSGLEEYAVLLLGATDASYDRLGIAIDPMQRADRDVLIESTKGVLSIDDWETAYQAGLRTPLEDALTAVAGASD
jgi:predicted ATPase/class 3 adenylate cyclase